MRNLNLPAFLLQKKKNKKTLQRSDNRSSTTDEVGYEEQTYCCFEKRKLNRKSDATIRSNICDTEPTQQLPLSERNKDSFQMVFAISLQGK